MNILEKEAQFKGKSFPQNYIAVSVWSRTSPSVCSYDINPRADDGRGEDACYDLEAVFEQELDLRDFVYSFVRCYALIAMGGGFKKTYYGEYTICIEGGLPCSK